MSNCNLFQYPWYYGKMGRGEAEKALMERGENEGSFIIRESQSQPGSWSLSVLYWSLESCSVGHYLINRDSNGKFYFEPEIQFDSIPLLIDHYQDNKSTAVKFVLNDPCPKKIEIPVRDEDHYDLYATFTELPRDSILKETLISKAVLSDVWRGHMQNDMHTEIVAKVANSHPESEYVLEQEANILTALQHENIVQVIGTVTTKPFCLVMRSAGEQNLSVFLLTIDSTKISLMEQLTIALQVSSALLYLSNMKCIHRDIKAKSIVIHHTNSLENMKCMLGDFKYCRKLDEFGYYHALSQEDNFGFSDHNRVRWMAPESILHGRFSTASDVWSFATFLVELFSHGGTPFPGYLTSKIIDELKLGFRNSKPRACPETIYKWMKQCWAWTDKERPAFSIVHKEIGSYIKQHYEALTKLVPAKSRPLARYVSLHVKVKQKRTAKTRTTVKTKPEGSNSLSTDYEPVAIGK